MERSLEERRRNAERAWRSAVADRWAPRLRPAPQVPPEVVESWRRSARSVDAAVAAAPVAGPEAVQARWADSRLGRASRIILDDLTDLARDGDMMAAITDDTVTIAWIAGGRTMSRRAERVHFGLGGCWAEQAVGTNALGLAHQARRPATVFSAEHFAPMVHEWVCYSAPILDPHSGRFLGVIDVSTTWARAHPTLLTTVSALARCVELQLAAAGGEPDAEAGLVLRTLGTPGVWVDGRAVPVSPRQVELLAVLSMHPDGLSLDELAGRVYGDRPVRPATVKAELSHLRHALGGRIGSRPYRLVGPVDADHLEAVDAVARGDVGRAVGLYRGQLLVTSESPELTAWRHHVDVTIREAVLASGDAELLWQLGEHFSDDLEVHERTLRSLARDDPRRSVVAGRLAAGRG